MYCKGIQVTQQTLCVFAKLRVREKQGWLPGSHPCSQCSGASVLVLRFCRRSLEILSHFLTRSSAFSFCTGPCLFCNWPEGRERLYHGRWRGLLDGRCACCCQDFPGTPLGYNFTTVTGGACCP